MTLRRTAAALPLALCVAVVAHVLGFGAAHGPGGGHAALLLWALAAALAACLGGAFAAGLAGSRISLATTGLRAYHWPILAVGGLLAFAAIEISEGHLLLGPGTVGALLALLPVAVLTAVFSGKLGRRASQAGRRTALWLRRAPGRAAAFASLVAELDAVVSGVLGAHAPRGRAPPQPA